MHKLLDKEDKAVPREKWFWVQSFFLMATKEVRNGYAGKAILRACLG